MNFTIEQIAFFPEPGQTESAIKLLTELGFNYGQDWVRDTVRATGEVFGDSAAPVGHLAFAYQPIFQPLEIEVLAYEDGQPNWMAFRPYPSVSHVAMHCTASELDAWHEKLTGLGISVAQSVITDSHTNPVIAGKRRYNYVIYDTRNLIGVDLKFIVRYTPDLKPYETPSTAKLCAEICADNADKDYELSPNEIAQLATDELVQVCHATAKKSGWWGGNGKPDPRDNPLCFSNKLLLVHSEISESCEGDRKGLMDDHLPKYEMRAVELADAAIRIFDLAGAFNIPLGQILAEKLAYNAKRADHKPENRALAGGKAY